VGAGVLCGLAGLAPAAPALGNDTTAELGTGGLDFVRNGNVEMRSEELFISTSEIRVVYHFFNKSDQPVTALVAFPMPEITLANQDANISVPANDPVNFLGFETKADDQTVEAQVQQRVVAKGIDRTEMLKALAIPLAPHLRAAYTALDALPKDKWQDLVSRGMAEIVEYAVGPDFKMRGHLEPRWTLRTTYYWQQVFPPRQELVIAHRYKPSVGRGGAGGLGGANANIDMKAYCIEPDIVAKIARLQAAARNIKDTYAIYQRIAYVLKTGANWAGPIADFTLTVDKGQPDNVLALCAKGFKKISPTQIQAHYSNFTPTRDLLLMIFTTKVAR
jgi:Domain of unknown function (DUF4424)